MGKHYLNKRKDERKKRDLVHNKRFTEGRLDLTQKFRPDDSLVSPSGPVTIIAQGVSVSEHKNEIARLDKFIKQIDIYSQSLDMILDPNTPNPARMYHTMDKIEEYVQQNERYISDAKLSSDVKQRYQNQLTDFAKKMKRGRKFVNAEAEKRSMRIQEKMTQKKIERVVKKEKIQKATAVVNEKQSFLGAVKSFMQKLTKKQGNERNVNSH